MPTYRVCNPRDIPQEVPIATYVLLDGTERQFHVDEEFEHPGGPLPPNADLGTWLADGTIVDVAAVAESAPPVASPEEATSAPAVEEPAPASEAPAPEPPSTEPAAPVEATPEAQAGLPPLPETTFWFGSAPTESTATVASAAEQPVEPAPAPATTEAPAEPQPVDSSPVVSEAPAEAPAQEPTAPTPDPNAPPAG